MFVFILILLLIAAIFGVLGAVLKLTVILVVAALLTVTVLAALAWWGFKRSARKLSAEYDRQISEHRVTKYRENEAGTNPPGRDDRY